MQENQNTIRRWAWFTLIVFLLFGMGQPIFGVGSVQAQDEAPVAAPADAGAEAGGDEVNILVYIFKASIPFFIVNLVLSVYLIQNIVSNYMKMQLKNVVPRGLTGNLDSMLAEEKYKEAYELLRGDSSLFGRSLTAGVERIQHSYDRAAEAMATVAEDGKLEMEHKVSPIATIGTVAPMLGLFGTVLGMILAFQTIAKGGQPKPAELAEKIGLALVTTLEGIFVAVPAIIAFAFLRNKISRLTYEVESLGEAYLWKFQGALKRRSQSSG